MLHRIAQSLLLATLGLWFSGAVQFAHEWQCHRPHVHPLPKGVAAAGIVDADADDDCDCDEDAAPAPTVAPASGIADHGGTPAHHHHDSHDGCGMCRLLATSAPVPGIPVSLPAAKQVPLEVLIPSDQCPLAIPALANLLARAPPILPA